MLHHELMEHGCSRLLPLEEWSSLTDLVHRADSQYRLKPFGAFCVIMLERG